LFSGVRKYLIWKRKFTNFFRTYNRKFYQDLIKKNSLESKVSNIESLFDDSNKDYTEHKLYIESTYDYLNHSAHLEIYGVRKLLDYWF